MTLIYQDNKQCFDSIRSIAKGLGNDSSWQEIVFTGGLGESGSVASTELIEECGSLHPDTLIVSRSFASVSWNSGIPVRYRTYGFRWTEDEQWKDSARSYALRISELEDDWYEFVYAY